MTPAEDGAQPDRPGPTVRIRLVGPLRVYVDGRRADDPPAGRAASLLARLAVDAGHLVPLDRIVDDLWPDGAPAKARQNVASLVSRLRRLVGRSGIEGSSAGYRLVVSGSLGTDLQEAQAATREAEAHLLAGLFSDACGAARRALQILEGGDLLENEPYTAWAEAPRRRAGALERRARYCLWTAAFALDDPRSAMDAATAAVEADPFDEEAHRALMRAEHRRGDRGAALLAFKRLERTLRDELQVDPDDETTALYTAIVAGKPEPAPAATASRHPPGDAPRGPRPAPFVGRRAELADLRDAWAAAVSGRGAMLFLCGPAGSGKSRLAGEVVALADADGGSTLRARCNEAERSLFLQPIVEALRGHLETAPDDVLDELVGSWAGTMGELLPSLRSRLGDPDYARIGPELEHRRSLEAVTEVVARIARRRPTLVVIEDLEHAGASTLEALRFMAGRLGDERLLLVITVRPEEGREALETLEHAGREIHLGRFSEVEVEQLAAAMGLRDLAGAVFQLTGGDVLFSVEAFRLAAGTARAADALQVARSLADVVVERVRTVGADGEEFLRVAAVAGSAFDLDLVGRIQGGDAEQAARLAERALEAGLLVSKDRGLAFANRVIHEVLYDSTPSAIRVSRHRRIAELVADRPELAAAHHEAAGDWLAACRAWAAAADAAQRRFANRDAERLLAAAVACAEQAGDEPTVAAMSLRRGQVREELGDYAGARADHGHALELARRVGDGGLEALALERLGWTAYYGRDVESAVDLAAQATALAEAAAAAPDARPSALVLVGRVRHWAGDMGAAAKAYDEALADGAEPATVASALSCLGALLEHGDRFDEARDVLVRAMAQCQETGSFRALLRTLFFAGLARANLGDLLGALRVLERKRALLDRYDVRFYRARTATTLSWVWRELGDRPRAEDLAQTAIEQAREVSGGSLQTEQELHALLAAAECRLLDDDPGAAAPYISEAEALLATWMPFRWRAELRVVEVASRLEPARAEHLLDLARQRGSAKYQALALGRLGRAEEAAAAAQRTGSALLLAEVAPEDRARAALARIASTLPREMRSRFVMQGRLTAPLRT